MECFGRSGKKKKSGVISNNDIINKNIQIEKERGKDDKRQLRFLLLGIGGSGKSTIFKQFRNVYGTPKSDDDLRMYGVVARSNIVTAITKLCELTRELKLEHKLVDESKIEDDTVVVPQDGHRMTVIEAYNHIVSYLVDMSATEPLPNLTEEQEKSDWVGRSVIAGSKTNADAIRCLQLADAIEILWGSPTIRNEVWQRRGEKNVVDAHNAFLNDIRRITSPRYIPTEEDVLKARVRTTQIVVNQYAVDGTTTIEVCDVGGQRTERRKWINCFDNVDALIFVTALSEYDQRLSEARNSNSMMESLNLFQTISENACFHGKPILLFLNKKDIFEDKIRYSNIADISHFADYEGPRHCNDSGIFYFITKFENLLSEERKTNTFMHVTNATDKKNMKFVLSATSLMIMKIVFEDIF
jgi:guanine nucleotide-binding protein G(o) subunit alpha